MNRLNTVLLLFIACVLISGCGKKKEEAKKVKPYKPGSPLISAEQLDLLISNDDTIRILETGHNKTNYDEGHIKNSQYVHWVTDMTDRNEADRYNVIDKQTMETLMRRLGIGNDTLVILYDDLHSRVSTRMYWTMKYYGHENVAILDGGRNVWKKNFELVTEVPEFAASEYAVSQVVDEYKTDMKFVADNLDSANVKFIDGRPKGQFTGEDPGVVFHTGKEHKNRGHVPGAKNLFWKDHFNEDGTFKSVKELTVMYTKAGVYPPHTVVTYCNEGLHAAAPWFVAKELLNQENVMLYDDSMSEWANSDQPTDVTLPVDDDNE